MLKCVKVTVTAEGPGWKPEPPAAEPVNACPGCMGHQACARASSAHRFSQVCPGQASTWLSVSLFIRGVNNPYIVFLLLDYFVFV